ncbi:MAG TPA: sigma-E factor negative regulatory protein [Steroidobacteraceae bacterium]|nr:sigma-E factor negative regulatory protein [Steroidobacteraceae bacterium]
MSEQIREQVSAFLDGELPNSETELLLKRLTRDAELRESFGRYALIGESLRGGTHARLSHGFPGRVNRAIDGEPLITDPTNVRRRSAVWWRPLAGAAVAAGVAAIAVVALQQRAVTPRLRAALPVTAPNAVTLPGGGSAPGGSPSGGSPAYVRVAQNGGTAAPREALSYTVPAPAPDAPAALPAARLTNYVFAHSKYSSVLGQNDVLNDLLSGADPEDGGAAAEAAAVGSNGRNVDDAAESRPPGNRAPGSLSPEARVAP